MFSGIVEEQGRVKRIIRSGRVSLLEINAENAAEGIRAGDSISVNGCCLTVIKIDKATLSFEAMPQTLKITNLGLLKPGDYVNLERALKIGERLSGHFVSGHIDCMGIIRKKRLLEGNFAIEVAVPAGFTRYVIPRGSVAVDGVSLTVVQKRSDSFTVYIIPHTLKNTSLGSKYPSDKVNVEFDMLIKNSLSIYNA